MHEFNTEKFYNEHRWNKSIIEMRKQEQVYFSIKDYANAERIKAICKDMEKKEVDGMQYELQIKLNKEEACLFRKQKN